MSNTGVDALLLMDVGLPVSIRPLQRRIRELEMLLVPAATSPEDRRELAMPQPPGSNVTVPGGVPVSV